MYHVASRRRVNRLLYVLSTTKHSIYDMHLENYTNITG